MNRLYALLEQYAQAQVEAGAAGDVTRIEASIWDEFGTEQTVFVLDMCGFSRHVRAYGLVHYMAMVYRMRMAVRSLIADHGGHIVKFEADNCFARFPEPAKAIDAAIAINKTLARSNENVPADAVIEVAIGIDAGRFLLIEDDNLFGDPVNIASRLGEDIGGAGDILVTERALGQVGDRAYEAAALVLDASGVTIAAHRIRY